MKRRTAVRSTELDRARTPYCPTEHHRAAPVNSIATNISGPGKSGTQNVGAAMLRE